MSNFQNVHVNCSNEVNIRISLGLIKVTRSYIILCESFALLRWILRGSSQILLFQKRDSLTLI